MSIEGADLMTVIDDNRPAVAATPSDEGHGAARWRANKCAPAGADVYASVKSRPGCARRAEVGTDRAVHRPSEPQRRKRLLTTVWSREVPQSCAMGRSLGDAVTAGHEPPVTGRDLGRLRAHDQDHSHGHYRPHREATHFQTSRAPQLSQFLRESSDACPGRLRSPRLRSPFDGATSTPAAILGVIESGSSRSSDEHATRRRPRIRAIRLRPPTENGLAGRSDSWR